MQTETPEFLQKALGTALGTAIGLALAAYGGYLMVVQCLQTVIV